MGVFSGEGAQALDEQVGVNHGHYAPEMN